MFMTFVEYTRNIQPVLLGVVESTTKKNDSRIIFNNEDLLERWTSIPSEIFHNNDLQILH